MPPHFAFKQNIFHYLCRILSKINHFSEDEPKTALKHLTEK